MPMIHDWEPDDFLHACVSIDRSDINHEFEVVAAHLAYWGEQYALAEQAVAEDKAQLESVEAELYARKRSALQLAAEKRVAGTKAKPERVTDTAVNSAVSADNGYRAAQQSLIDSETRKTRVRGIIEAVKTKREMLVSLGAQLRAEMRGEPHITDKPADWKY